MKKISTRLMLLGALLVVSSIMFAACAAPTAEPQEEPTEEAEHAEDEEHDHTEDHVLVEGDVARGGKLYTKWYAALGLDKPTEDQPLWATQATNERTGADTWRCKECHGWDYIGADGWYNTDSSHYTGFAGVFEAQDMSAEVIVAWLDGTTNADHDFSVMGEDAMIDLATFLQEGMLDNRDFIDYETGIAITADVDHGKELYTSTCNVCHGEDGRAIEGLIIGAVLHDEPWVELNHLVRTGMPGTSMPASHDLGWSIQDVLDVLTYEATLPTEAP